MLKTLLATAVSARAFPAAVDDIIADSDSHTILEGGS